MESGNEIKLTEEQLLAVEMVKKHNMSILTGGPGTGKTTTVREILRWAKEAGLSIAQCAPTGKAAKRMIEATGHTAMTIHSLLGAQMEDGQFSFGVNEENPLTVDFLIVDELSMVSSELMSDLLRAVKPPFTKVLFVGDQGQLPSVGPGAVLRDLLASECIPHVQLTKIHRNSGEIVKACHAIHKGVYYEPCSKLDINSGFNLRHIEVSSASGIAETIQKLIDKAKDPTSNLHGYDPIWDIQVISPTNSRSPLSCDGMNEVLQKQLNPLPEGKVQAEGFKFREGDKVIQIKNAKVDDAYGLQTFVVNGDMGKIVELKEESNKMLVQFFDPERIVPISKKRNDLLLAYCVTCHRVQGSETPIAIIPVHKLFQYFVNRSWIYTAISRAKVMCFTIGQFSAIESAITNNGSQHRVTRLKEKIIESTIGDI